MSAKVIQVICAQEIRGTGAIGDPFRNVNCYYTFGGELLALNDPHWEDLRNNLRTPPEMPRGYKHPDYNTDPAFITSDLAANRADTGNEPQQ